MEDPTSDVMQAEFVTQEGGPMGPHGAPRFWKLNTAIYVR